MFCPKCGKSIPDTAKFCKYCGASIGVKSNINNTNSMVKQQNNEDRNKNIIIVALIVVIAIASIVCVAYATGVFDNKNNAAVVNSTGSNSVQASQSSSQGSSQSSLKILGGSMNTPSADSAKTYASFFVGKEHAGETVKVTALWSRNGNNLNNGNIVTVTVTSDGYANFRSADAFKYYPDKAVCKLYYADGTLADTKTVTLSPTSGTQTF